MRPCSSCTKGLNRLLVGQATIGWTATYLSSTPAHLFTQVCNLFSRFFSLFSSFFLSLFLTMLVPSPLFFYLFLASHHDNRPTVVYRCLVWSWIHGESVHSRCVNFYWYKSSYNFCFIIIFLFFFLFLSMIQKCLLIYFWSICNWL